MSRPSRRVLSLVLSSLLLAASLPSAIAGTQEDERARNAVRVLTDIQAIPENAIPDKLLDEARAIVIVPDTIKAGLVIGGRRGHGVMAIKNPDGTWSSPAFVSLTGGSIGFQAGVQSADVVLVFRSDRGLDSIVNGKFTPPVRWVATPRRRRMASSRRRSGRGRARADCSRASRWMVRCCRSTTTPTRPSTAKAPRRA
jgi:hypothetical protein